MCHDYRLEVSIASVMEGFEDLEIAVYAPEGTPNVAAREDIRDHRRGACREERPGRWRSRRTRKPEIELGGRARQARLQFPRGWPGVRLEALPDPRRWVLRVHEARRPEAEAQGQVALYLGWKSLVLHRRHLAREPGWRGLHHADAGSRRGGRTLSRPADCRAAARSLGGMARPLGAGARRARRPPKGSLEVTQVYPPPAAQQGLL